MNAARSLGLHMIFFVVLLGANKCVGRFPAMYYSITYLCCVFLGEMLFFFSFSSPPLVSGGCNALQLLEQLLLLTQCEKLVVRTVSLPLTSDLFLSLAHVCALCRCNSARLFNQRQTPNGWHHVSLPVALGQLMRLFVGRFSF